MERELERGVLVQGMLEQLVWVRVKTLPHSPLLLFLAFSLSLSLSIPSVFFLFSPLVLRGFLPLILSSKRLQSLLCLPCSWGTVAGSAEGWGWSAGGWVAGGWLVSSSCSL